MFSLISICYRRSFKYDFRIHVLVPRGCPTYVIYGCKQSAERASTYKVVSSNSPFNTFDVVVFLCGDDVNLNKLSSQLRVQCVDSLNY